MKFTKDDLDGFVWNTAKSMGLNSKYQKMVVENVRKRLDEYFLSNKINTELYGEESKVRDEAREAFRKFVVLQTQRARNQHPDADDGQIEQWVKDEIAEAIREEEQEYYGDDAETGTAMA
jgi:hypothetical protein